jgi:hypothetical protein
MEREDDTTMRDKETGAGIFFTGLGTGSRNENKQNIAIETTEGQGSVAKHLVIIPL